MASASSRFAANATRSEFRQGKAEQPRRSLQSQSGDPGQGMLEPVSVSTTVGVDYLARVQNFRYFVTDAGLSSRTVKQIDTALVAFFHNRSVLERLLGAGRREDDCSAMRVPARLPPVFKTGMVRARTGATLIGRAPLSWVLLVGNAAYWFRRNERLKGGALLLTPLPYLRPSSSVQRRFHSSSQESRSHLVSGNLSPGTGTQYKDGSFRRLSDFGHTRVPDAGLLAEKVTGGSHCGHSPVSTTASMVHRDRTREQPRTGLRTSESTPIPAQAWTLLFGHAVKSRDPYRSPKAGTMGLSIVRSFQTKKSGRVALMLRSVPDEAMGYCLQAPEKIAALVASPSAPCPAVVAGLRKSWELQTITQKALPESSDTRKRVGAAQENAAGSKR